MNIPYTYLAVLLVFTLLVGVVIGDRLAAGAGVDVGVDGYGPGRSGGCTGLASARLHACVHRYGRLGGGHVRAAPRPGGVPWDNPHHTDAACGLAELDD